MFLINQQPASLSEYSHHTRLLVDHLAHTEAQTWGQFNSGIGIDGQFQFQFWNWNCLFEKIIELELNFL